MLRLIVFGLAALMSAQAQTREFDVSAATGWLDTGIQLQPGDTLRITAAGTLQYANARPCGPEGLNRGWADLIRQMAVNEAGRGALIGRIGASDAARAFLVGSRRESRAPVGGKLFLGINQGANDSATGSFHVTVEQTAAATAPQPATASVTASMTQNMIDSIPLRVQDAQGEPGDRVNFILAGSLEQVQAALKAAGWTQVDRNTKDAFLRGALASLSKQAYVTMPMSELLLFGRAQDFGYAQGDPVRVVASRHHFRLWKAPFDLDGRAVWVGAGTHDIGFDRDQRNGHLTHKIDPEVDKEREYIKDSLTQTGMVAKAEYLTPADAITRARTAHGEEFSSDGRTLVLYFPPDAGNLVAAFGDLFCSVLRQNNPGGGDWGPCSRYIDTPGKADVKLGPLTKDYRVLIVPGIFSSCVADSPAFDEGQQALRKQYGLDVDLLQVPNDSSEANARLIAQYVREHAAADPRKYILIGYSKGAPDIQVALAKEPGLAGKVAAFITVAGASGGSPIADALPKQAEAYMGRFSLPGCKGDLATGFRSLKREVRQAFLSSYPRPLVPTYSLIGKSDKTTTSKALMESWLMLASFGMAQDGQLMKEDAIVPEAKYLGAAIADHFAIALPFDRSADSAIRAGMDHNAYPRAALLEALLRLVTADLAAH